MNIIRYSLAALCFIALSNSVFAERNLDIKKADRQEIRHSMIGYRSTLVFYTFKDEKAILVLSIGNTDETFPMSGQVHLFDMSTTSEGLDKWINNQHSCGLYPEVPNPELSKKLPDDICGVASFEQTGTSQNQGINQETYKDYKVQLSVKAHNIAEGCKLLEFKDAAQVHVKK